MYFEFKSMKGESEVVNKLMQKMESPIQEIQQRAITTMHTKISLGVVPMEDLPAYREFPAVLMNWINDHRDKSDPLLKVLEMLAWVGSSQAGLVLLQRYQCLEFCEQFRNYFITHHNNIDVFIEHIDCVIQRLLPLGRTHSEKPSISQEAKEEVRVQVPVQQKVENKGWAVNLQPIRSQLKAEQEKTIFNLTVQLKYGKTEQIYPCLRAIYEFVEEFSSAWWKSKPELVQQLCDCIGLGYPWLVSEILTILMKGLFASHRQGRKQKMHLENKIIDFGKIKIFGSQQIDVSFCLPKKIFQFEECFLLTELLIENEDIVGIGWIDEAYKEEWCGRYIFRLVQKIGQKKIVNKPDLLEKIDYICRKNPELQESFISILGDRSEKVPSLKEYTEKCMMQLSYGYIEEYFQAIRTDEGYFGKHLHILPTIVEELHKALPSINNKPEIVQVYVEVVLTLSVSVLRSDPLKSYFPGVEAMLTTISSSQNLRVRTALHQYLLYVMKTREVIFYAQQQYPLKQALKLLCQNGLAGQILQKGMEHEKTLDSVLQVMRALVLNGFGEYVIPYTTLIFFVSHEESDIGEIASLLLKNLPQSLNTQLSLIFSSNPDIRMKAISHSLNLQQDIVKKIFERQAEPPKKPLKIANQSILNFMNIILNESLEVNVRISAAGELSSLLPRIQHLTVSDELNEFNSVIVREINKKMKNQSPIWQHYIYLHFIIYEAVQVSTTFENRSLIQFLNAVEDEKVQECLITLIYYQVFEDPFQRKKQTCHWTASFFPHLQLKKLHSEKHFFEEKYHKKAFQETIDNKKDRNKMGLCQNILDSILTGFKQKLNESQLESEVVECISQGKQSKLNYLTFLIHHFGKENLPSSPSLSSVVSNFLLKHKAIGPYSQKDLLRILLALPDRPSKCFAGLPTLPSLSTVIQISLLEQSPQIQPSQVQATIKLLNSDEKKYRLQIMSFLASQKQRSLKGGSQYINLCLVQTIIKEIKQQNNFQAAKTALILLQRMIRQGVDLSDHRTSILSTFIGIFQTQIKSGLAIIINDCIAMLVQNTIESEIPLFENYLSLTLPLLNQTCASLDEKNILLIGSLFHTLNSLLQESQRNNLAGPILRQILRPADLVDVAVQRLSIRDSDEQTFLILGMIANFLSFSIHFDLNLEQYLLSSSNILTHLVHIFRNFLSDKNVCNQGSFRCMNSICGLWTLLAQNKNEFIYKLSKLLSENQDLVPLNDLIMLIWNVVRKIGLWAATRDERIECSFLDALGWTIVIWDKDRECLEDKEIAPQIVQVFLSTSRDITKLRSLVAVSNTLKKSVLASFELTSELKKNHKLIDDAMIKGKRNTLKLKNQESETVLKQIKSIIDFIISLTHKVEYQIEVPSEECSALEKQNTFSLIKWAEKLSRIEEIESAGLSFMLKEVFSNLCSNELFANWVNNYYSEMNSGMVDELISRILRWEEQQPQRHRESIEMMQTLIKCESIRSILLKSRLVDQVAQKLNQLYEMKSSKTQINLPLLFSALKLTLSLSVWKQTNQRLLNKFVLETLVQILSIQPSEIIEELIVDCLVNFACYKHHKPIFMASKEVHKVCLGLLGDSNIGYRGKLLYLLYNIIYKNAAGLKIYRKQEVVQMLKQLNFDENYMPIYGALVDVLDSDE